MCIRGRGKDEREAGEERIDSLFFFSQEQFLEGPFKSELPTSKRKEEKSKSKIRKMERKFKGVGQRINSCEEHSRLNKQFKPFCSI